MRLRIMSISECAHIYVWFIYVFVSELKCAPVHVEARSLCQMSSSTTVPYILNLELMNLIG